MIKMLHPVLMPMDTINLYTALFSGTFQKLLKLTKEGYQTNKLFFYNCHRVYSLLFSLELSFRSLLHSRQTSNRIL